jgi:hypothetical protein
MLFAALMHPGRRGVSPPGTSKPLRRSAKCRRSVAALGAAAAGDHVLSHKESVPVDEKFLALVAKSLLPFIARKVPAVNVLEACLVPDVFCLADALRRSGPDICEPIGGMKSADVPGDVRIEIDHSQKAKDVAEITETDYFKYLQKKAKDLKAARE